MQQLKRTDLKKFTDVRLVGEDLNQILSINEAWNKAEEQDLDLVLVSDNPKLPVVKIVDFNKLKYQQKKKRKNTKKTELKELQFKPNIDENDLQVKLKKAKKFLDQGNKVKILMRARGRERGNPERIKDLLNKIINSLPCKAHMLPGLQGAILEFNGEDKKGTRDE